MTSSDRHGFVLARARTRVAALAEAEPKPSIFNLPNAITLAGYAASIVWLAGGSVWFAVAGILCDELDGYAARGTGQTSSFGSLFDWGTDIALTGATAVKLGGPFLYALPLITGLQVYLRDNETRPEVGSIRAAMMIYGIVT